MTEEQKQLLMKDLCGRLPYGVKAQFPDHYGGYISTIEYIDIDGYAKDFEGIQYEIGDFKPYLFPISSMSEAKKEEYLKTGARAEMYGLKDVFIPCLETFDWLNAHHFDYRGLIEQGLAIDVTDLNIYINKEEQQ